MAMMNGEVTFSDGELTCANAVRKPMSEKSLPLGGPCQPYSGVEEQQYSHYR